MNSALSLPSSAPTAFHGRSLPSLLLVVFVSLLALTCPARAETEVDQLETIKKTFDQLSESVKRLEESTATINTRIGACAGYLDTLGSSPVQVAGMDLSSAVSGAQNLGYTEWNNLATANKSSIADLLLRDSAVRKAVLEIKTETVAITDEVNRLKPEVTALQTGAALLGAQLKDYMKDNRWKVLQLTPLLVKIGNVGKDTTKLLQTAQGTLGQSGAVLTKLGVVTSLLPADDPLLADLAKIEPQPVTLPGVESGAAALAAAGANPLLTALLATAPAAAGASETPAQGETASSPAADGITGFWQEASTGDQRLRLLLGTPRVGQASGFAILPGGEVQTTLVFLQKQGERLIYGESREGYRYEIASDGGELSLKHSGPGGATVFRVFLTRP